MMQTQGGAPDLRMDRREFIKLAGSTAALGAHGAAAKRAFAAGRRKARPRNILLIVTDQQHIDTVRAGGCRHVQTPALDRLKRGGVSFIESYSANPLCSPARSAIFTGRTSSEAAVHVNGRSIRPDIPNLGQWFSEHTDYETFYAGKWHLPRTYTSDIDGFNVLHTGIGGFGHLCDTLMSRACEGFLRSRARSRPFLLTASFMQPHDICEWLRMNMNDPGELRYPEIEGQLPELPDNFGYDAAEPEPLKRKRRGDEPFRGRWSQEHWRYYRWSYYRHIEHLDAEIGRVLRALEDGGYLEDMLVVLTSDHGEGMGHHQTVRKSSLYDESAKVPLIFSWPGHVRQDAVETTAIVSGLDIMPTLCDFAGIRPPQKMRGQSLRPILEGRGGIGRGFIVSEVGGNAGRMVRTGRFKYVTYVNDPVEQWLDMRNDRGETRNLAALTEQDTMRGQYQAVAAEHRTLLKEWERRLDVPKGVPHAGYWREKS